MILKRYFKSQKSGTHRVVLLFLIAFFIFSVVFFLWSLMKYNKIMEDKKNDEAYIERLTEENAELRYLIEAPLDDAYKIKIAREKLGMCFPDEIIFYSQTP